MEGGKLEKINDSEIRYSARAIKKLEYLMKQFKTEVLYEAELLSKMGRNPPYRVTTAIIDRAFRTVSDEGIEL